MKRILTIFFAVFCLATVEISAQSCYQIGLDEGRVFYNEALRLKNSNRCDEAAQQFWAALRRFRLTRRCADLPTNHELDSSEDRCINGITDCGYIPGTENIVRQELRITPQTIDVDEKSGETIVNVTTNVADWLVSQAPAWITVSRQGSNRLSIRYAENAGTNIREGVVIISANTLQARILIRQEGMSCYEAGMSESRALFTEAQRLQSIGSNEEAAQHFLAAFKKVKETEENCTDIPADNELEIIRDNISQTVSETGYIIENEIITPRIVRETLQPIVFPERGGEATLSLTGVADDWTVTAYPTWSIARKEGARLTVWCSENNEINGRQEEILITAGMMQIIIPVVQEGNACYEAGMSQSRILFAEAQRLQSMGNRDEAAQYFLAAFKIVKETEENCRAIPEIHELEIITEEIIQGIEESGYMLTENEEIVRIEEPRDNPRFYLAMAAGLSSFGEISTAKVKNGASGVIEADVAYFSTPHRGIGIKYHGRYSNVNFKLTDSNSEYNETIHFIGLAYYGRYGKSKVSLTASIAVGGLFWMVDGDSEVIENYFKRYNELEPGGMISVGIDYMFTQNFGVHMNVQTPIGIVKLTQGVNRNPMAPGVSFGIITKF